MAQGELRHRKNNPKKKPKQQTVNEKPSDKDDKNKGKSQGDGAASTAAPEEGQKCWWSLTRTAGPEEETLWQTFSSHPLVVVCPIILIPYAFYVAFYFAFLKRPELVTQATLGHVSMRPAVRLYDQRQVLIIGSMGSGTQKVATAMSQVMGLEIGHEVTNAESYFTRDGTVSSFLGLRFSPRSVDAEPGQVVRLVGSVCLERGKGSGDSFHPKHYQPSSCSPYKTWSKCHSRECLDFVANEWGCGLLEDGCSTPFVSVLHQVQHPLRTIRELMAKVCPGSAKSVHPSFRQMATVFFDDSDATSCLEAVSWYVVHFNQALLAARHEGRVDGMFQYERSCLCDIVDFAGFLDPQRAVYPPNVAKLSKLCEPERDQTDATKRLPLLETRKDETRTLPVFTWEDFREAGGAKLENNLRRLCRDLGYKEDEEFQDEDKSEVY